MNYNKQQLAIINSNAQFIEIIAGAGTGKSTTIAAKIIKLIFNKK